MAVLFVDTNITDQNVPLFLSIAGVVFLFVCLLLIMTNRVPAVKSPEVIEAFGVKLNVSVTTILVLVGLLLSFTSISLQVKNYQGQIVEAQKAATQAQLDAQNVKQRWENEQKLTYRPFVILTGVSPSEMPPLADLSCSYGYLQGPVSSEREARLSAGIGPTSLQVNIEDIPAGAQITRLEITQHRKGKPDRKWVAEGLGNPLAPTLSGNEEM